MKFQSDQFIFESYTDYIDYQVNMFVTPIDHPSYKGVLDSHNTIIKEYLGDIKNDSCILDCGCGYGTALQAFRACGYKNVVGADISESRLANAIEIGYPLIKIDIQMMSAIKASSFDVVYSSHSLEHALYPDRALSEMQRILKPEGILILTLPFPVIFDDDYFNKKAYCGAEYLNLTVEDGGSRLIKTVEAFGFFLQKQKIGTYRSDKEMYLRFVKSNLPTIVVNQYGPHSTTANTKFNVQPNGMSALWFVLENERNSNLVVKFGDYILKSVRHRNLLSALVPDTLLFIPRKVEITVFEVDRSDSFVKLPFEIKVNPLHFGNRLSKPPSQKSKKPNLFIIGAPRSATTSLYWKLVGHPDIFMSKIKEPFFFDKRAHGLLSTAINSEAEYYKLFQYAPYQSKYIGEASVTYLSSPEALKQIYGFNKEAKIIVILRNPIEASISMYVRTRYGGKYEKSVSFESAWHDRNSKQRPFIVRYEELFQIGDQLRNVLSIFSEDQLKVILYDDLVSDPENVYRQIMSFLQLSIENDIDLIQGNSANWGNIHAHASDSLFAEMVDCFKQQVEIVSSITKRNLYHWIEK